MSADDVALPAFADGRAAIDPYRLVVGSTAANPQHATAGWDRRAAGRTDARQLHRRCSAYYVSSANNSSYTLCQAK